MKRAILTIGSLAAATAASAKGADTILEKDPVGIYVTIVSVVTVMVALVVLATLIFLFARIMVKSAQKKASQSKARASVVVDDVTVSVPLGCDSVVNGEIIAAIALAVKLNRDEMHDHESDVITINKVARVYSPWSSKIHGLTPMPERINRK